MNHVFAPTPITEEVGTREPEGGEKIVMVDAAIHAIQELMWKHPEALLYGQDVGERIGGVFRETVTLGKNSEAKEFSIPRFRKLISLVLQRE
jgi:2-oxoisovalerate dehydrogenase E1 component